MKTLFKKYNWLPLNQVLFILAQAQILEFYYKNQGNWHNNTSYSIEKIFKVNKLKFKYKHSVARQLQQFKNILKVEVYVHLESAFYLLVLMIQDLIYIKLIHLVHIMSGKLLLLDVILKTQKCFQKKDIMKKWNWKMYYFM